MFQKQMQPYPTLTAWSRQVQLPKHGLRLHLYDTGDESKPSVLLLHGLGDEADTWRHVLPAITNQYRGIAPDLPGFGRSDKPDRRYSIPFFVDCMLELLDQLSLKQVILVGHSTGAVIAHTIAMQSPERVDRLILIGGSLVSQTNRLTTGLLLFLIPGLGEWQYNRLRKDGQAAYQTLAPYYYSINSLPQADRDFLYQRVNERVWSDGQRRGFFATLRSLVRWLPAQQKGLAERMSSWKTPTTVIWGEADLISSVENAHALKQMLPAARLVIVPETGHNVQQEQPQAVIEAIVAGLRV